MQKPPSQQKRYVTIAEYGRMTGLSYPTILKNCKDGTLKSVQTEAGHYKIDVQAGGTSEIAAIAARLDELGETINAIAGRFGIPAQKAVK